MLEKILSRIPYIVAAVFGIPAIIGEIAKSVVGGEVDVMAVFIYILISFFIFAFLYGVQKISGHFFKH